MALTFIAEDVEETDGSLTDVEETDGDVRESDAEGEAASSEGC